MDLKHHSSQTHNGCIQFLQASQWSHSKRKTPSPCHNDWFARLNEQTLLSSGQFQKFKMFWRHGSHIKFLYVLYKAWFPYEIPLDSSIVIPNHTVWQYFNRDPEKSANLPYYGFRAHNGGVYQAPPSFNSWPSALPHQAPPHGLWPAWVRVVTPSIE